MSCNCKKILQIFIPFIFAGAIVLCVYYFIIQKADETPETPDFLSDILNQLSIYPLNSYQASISSFNRSNDPNALFLPWNESLINRILNTDNGSLIFRPGSAEYLYFRVKPNFLNPVFVNNFLAVGIYFGNNPNRLTVVPVFKNRTLTEGVDVFPTNLTDASQIIRIRIYSPINLCSTSTGDTACAQTRYNGYLLYDWNKRSFYPYQVQVEAACGDVCSQPDQYPTCSNFCGMSCSDSKFNGSDTNVSQIFSMTYSTSAFLFSFKTIRGFHRFQVEMKGKTVVDTDCIQVGSESSRWLLPADDFVLRVIVQPNCNCKNHSDCTGGEWYFIVRCPGSCPPAESVDYQNANQIDSVGQRIYNNLTLYIDQSGQMPPLLAASCDDVDWRIEFSYQAPFQGAYIFSAGVAGHSNKNSQFDIVTALNKTIGGAVTASWVNWSTGKTGTLNFQILGTQPSTSMLVAYFESMKAPWFAKKIAAQTSLGGTQFTPQGYPYYSANSNQYGIFQISTTSYEIVWNWKSNIQMGLENLNDVYVQATNWMVAQTEFAQEDCGDAPLIPRQQVGLFCDFQQQGNQTILDGVTIKMYDPYYGVQFCSWNHQIKFWVFNQLNAQGKNYLQSVCNQTI